jgi:hypothetical protein
MSLLLPNRGCIALRQQKETVSNVQVGNTPPQLLIEEGNVPLPPPTVQLDANMAFHLTVQVWAAPATTLRLDFSLQRHHYLHTAAGRSEAMNSLFFATVTPKEIEGEMTEIGLLLQNRAQGVQAQAAILANAAFAAAAAAGGNPAGPRGIDNQMPGLWQPPPALWDDYKVQSGRMYRVDATNQQARTTQVNHLFVILGPSVWGGVSQQNWLAAQAIRRVELAGAPVAQLISKFRSMRNDPRVNVMNNHLFARLDAARTTLGPGCDLEALKRVSNNASLVIELAKLAKG